MDNEFGTLRKKAFGGFNPKDVVDIIEKTRNELHDYKNSAEKSMEELKEKIEKLEAEKAALEKVNEDLAKANSELLENAKNVEPAEESAEAAGDSLTVIEINAATNELKKVADDLCTSLRDFMDRIAQNSISVVVENSDKENDEDFNAEKFMAELEAEIYAKLGVEAESDEVSVEVYTESAEDVKAEAEEKAEVEEAEDKVSLILAQTAGFAQNAEKKPEVKENPAKKNVLDILNRASFAN